MRWLQNSDLPKGGCRVLGRNDAKPSGSGGTERPLIRGTHTCTAEDSIGHAELLDYQSRTDLFAAVAGVLPIDGVMGYSVSQRTREIGIRMAIGARQRDMSLMVIRRSLVLTAAGVSVGRAASLGLSRSVQSQLFAVEPSDPATIGSVIVLMTAVAVVAGYVPARRAARVDPALSVRSQ